MIIRNRTAWLIFYTCLVGSFIAGYTEKGPSDVVFFAIANLWLIAIYLKSKEERGP